MLILDTDDTNVHMSEPAHSETYSYSQFEFTI